MLESSVFSLLPRDIFTVAKNKRGTPYYKMNLDSSPRYARL